MGGRGPESRFVGPEQLVFSSELKEKVEIIKAQVAERNTTQVSECIVFCACECCKTYSIHIETEYEKCPVCGWIDDPYQNTHPDAKDGKNPISLNEAKKMYAIRIGLPYDN